MKEALLLPLMVELLSHIQYNQDVQETTIVLQIFVKMKGFVYQVGMDIFVNVELTTLDIIAVKVTPHYLEIIVRIHK